MIFLFKTMHNSNKTFKMRQKKHLLLIMKFRGIILLFYNICLKIDFEGINSCKFVLFSYKFFSNIFEICLILNINIILVRTYLSPIYNI